MADLLDAPRREELTHLTVAAASIAGVLAACREGRVATLFVRPDRLVWGRLEQRGAPVEHGQREPGDAELVSATIAATLGQGGRVMAAGPDELPDDAAVAAVLRY